MISKIGSNAIRAAVYTRKSVEEGLEQEFNTLHAQRESGEAYIKSQQHEGWELVPQMYDDGGFTGANMDRPALKRLLADIESGLVNMVVVYKVDRLSRSLLDFSRVMEVFVRRGVGFVSVTQQFNTGTSMGRLMLNVLLTFAQFEREIIAERVRDKIAAARRKGKYIGGRPILGYDLDRETKKLVVNEAEAKRVRQIFQLYLKLQSLFPLVQTLADWGWTNKRWLTLEEKWGGGKAFTTERLYKLLKNPVYIGQVTYKGELHPGQQSAIVEEEVWHQAQSLLAKGHRQFPPTPISKTQTLLQGLVRCRTCGYAMTPTTNSKTALKKYRYYICVSVQKHDWNACATKSVCAPHLEQFVVDQLRQLRQEWIAAGAVNSQNWKGFSEPQLTALSAVDGDWGTLDLACRVEIVRSLVSQVAYNGVLRCVSLTLKNGREGRDCAEDHGVITIEKAVDFGLLSGKAKATQQRNLARRKRIPRASRLMAVAIHYDELLQKGIVKSFRELAKLTHVSTAEITNIMNLLLLAPEIQEWLLFLPPSGRGSPPVRLKELQNVAQQFNWTKQRSSSAIASQLIRPPSNPTVECDQLD